MDKETILVVDDEHNIIELARLYLEKEGYRVESASDGGVALDRVRAVKPALVILDLMLPVIDGWEVCRRLHAECDIPILMLTARSDDVDKIVGLELGADDYLTKPFNPRELVARVKAILRRTERGTTTPKGLSKVLSIGNVTIDPDKREVEVEGQAIDLRTREFDLLYVLTENPSMVFSREQLLNQVWGFDFYGETRTVDVHIARLRDKLQTANVSIETVWGIGYKLVGN
jgi:two-component system alkaline phosphatase synthesis response regulator PhoP